MSKETAIMYIKGDRLYDAEGDRTVWFSHVLTKEEVEAHGKEYVEHNPWTVVFPDESDLHIDGAHTCDLVPINRLLEDGSDLVKSIKKMYAGQKVLAQLHKLNDQQLGKKLTEIVGDKLKHYRQEDFFQHCGSSTRILDEFKCKSIAFDFYDQIIVTHAGIELKFEHTGRVMLAEFNDHFTLGEMP